MPIDDSEWTSIHMLVEDYFRKAGAAVTQGVVLKRDELRQVVWVKEFGDTPIPVVGKNSQMYVYTNGERKLVEIPPMIPMTGENVLLALVGQQPRCIGRVSEKPEISTPPLLIGGTVPLLVSSLPTSPTDGQEVYYLADATNGVLWRLRYRAASASAYKWEFLGGSELINIASAHIETTSALYVVGDSAPSIVAPLAGDYMVEFGGRLYQTNNAAGAATMALFVGTTLTAAILDHYQGSVATSITIAATHGSRKFRTDGVTAGTSMNCRYKTTLGTAAFEERWLSLRPVRVN